jgi:hypothetical protein
MKATLNALLIDPWQRRIFRLRVPADLDTWYKLLDCTCVDRYVLARDRQHQRELDLWIDDDGLLKEPPAARFLLANDPAAKDRAVFTGYALVLEADTSTGDSISCNLAPADLATRIEWEDWEARLDPADYFAQLTRVPDWEIRN